MRWDTTRWGVTRRDKTRHRQINHTLHLSCETYICSPLFIFLKSEKFKIFLLFKLFVASSTGVLHCLWCFLKKKDVRSIQATKLRHYHFYGWHTHICRWFTLHWNNFFGSWRYSPFLYLVRTTIHVMILGKSTTHCTCLRLTSVADIRSPFSNQEPPLSLPTSTLASSFFVSSLFQVT